MTFTTEQLQQMASQLSHPKGEEGIGVAEMMHASNFGMTKSTVQALQISTGNQILELGHGSGKHVPFILQQAEEINYDGLEISVLMKSEAERFNSKEQVAFHLYDGHKIPFKDHYFQKALTVNTIYFWKDPLATLKEVERVLQPGGIFCIGFAQKQFMEILPFTKYGFDLYDEDKLRSLVKQSPLQFVKIDHHQEDVTSKTGEVLVRHYSVATLKKQG